MTDRRRTHDQRPMTDPDPLVHAWLRQPVDLPESDLARIAWLVNQTPQQRRPLLPAFPRSSASMFTALKLTAAGAVLASLGLVLWSVAPTQNPDQPPTVVASPSASPLPVASPVVSPAASALPGLVASPSSVVSPAPSVSPVAPLGPVVLQLQPGDLTRVGDWVKVAAGSPVTADGSVWSELSDLQSVGGHLVARASLNLPDETAEDHILVSADGRAWSQVDVPGTDPEFTHLVSGSDGLLLAGSEKDGKKRAARLWASADGGLTWTPVPAPTRTSVARIVQSDPELTVVIAGNRTYLSREGGDWENQGQTIEVLRPQRGPGGFIFCCDGGDGQMVVLTWNDEAWTTGQELGDPGEPGDPDIGPATDVRLAPMGDQWVLVPGRASYPDVLFTSPDAKTDWTTIPRPAGLVGEELRWMQLVDGQAIAFGLSLDDEGVGAIWTWSLGEEAAAPALFPRADESIGQPVAWDDTWAATGLFRGETSELSVWQISPLS